MSIDTNDSSRPVKPDALRLRVAVLATLQDRVKVELDKARGDLHKAMDDGESHTVWSPGHEREQIATVNRSKPKPTARVVDDEAFDDWVAAEFPEAVSSTREVTEEGVSFLLDVAPELLVERRHIADWARQAALKQAAARLGTIPDGVEVVTAPAGRLSLRLSPEAGRLVSELVTAGVVDHLGALREIEAP